MQLSLVEVESKVNQKEMNKSVNVEIYDSASSGILISLFKSLETYMCKPPIDEELAKGYNSDREVEPFGLRIQNDSEDKETL